MQIVVLLSIIFLVFLRTGRGAGAEGKNPGAEPEWESQSRDILF